MRQTPKITQNLRQEIESIDNDFTINVRNKQKQEIEKVSYYIIKMNRIIQRRYIMSKHFLRKAGLFSILLLGLIFVASGVKPAAAKKPATQTAAKKPAVPAAANTSMKVTTTEKKLVESYRGATSDQKKIALKVLKGDYGDKVIDILNLVGGTGSASTADNLGDALGNLLGGLLTGGK